jgi:hypothetical protein
MMSMALPVVEWLMLGFHPGELLEEQRDEDIHLSNGPCHH